MKSPPDRISSGGDSCGGGEDHGKPAVGEVAGVDLPDGHAGGVRPGETSDLITADDGYYVARLDSLRPGGQQSFDDVRDLPNLAFAVARYNPNGTIDTGFGYNSFFPGTVLTDFGKQHPVGRTVDDSFRKEAAQKGELLGGRPSLRFACRGGLNSPINVFPIFFNDILRGPLLPTARVDPEGDPARAALATAERYNLQGEPALALPNAEQAMMGIPVGTPDWLRAQDIAMVSRTAVARRRDR